MPSIEEQAADIYASFSNDKRAQVLKSLKLSDVPKWESGQLALDMREELEDRYSVTAIYHAVGLLYHCKGSTIRRRVFVSKNIPPDLVKDYPHLTYNYWKVIADANHADNKLQSIYEVLLWISNYQEQYKNLPPVDLVEVWVRGDDRVDHLWRLRGESAVALLDKLYYDDKTPTAFKILVGWCRGMLSQYLELGYSPLEIKQKKGEAN